MSSFKPKPSFKSTLNKLYQISEDMELYVNDQVTLMKETISQARHVAAKKKISVKTILRDQKIMQTCVVEIPKHSVVKIEMNDEYNIHGIYHPVVDRLVKIQFANTYGYIPHTKEEDGDCIDAYVLIPEFMDTGIFDHPGLQVEGIPILTLVATDNGQYDNKVVTIPYALFDYFMFDTPNEYDFLAQVFSITIQFYRYKENCYIEDFLGFEDTTEYIKKNKADFAASLK